MRDVIALALVAVLAPVAVLLFRLLVPAGGHHAADPACRPLPAAGPAPTLHPAARRPKPWSTPSSAQVRAIFHAEEVQGLTPEQRERWWATAFAEIGVEYTYRYDGDHFAALAVVA
ncbi:hypothetical protein ACFZB6_26555 [Streptomyces syringium]|uniref:hypothetical protein n=1 Tax=Streptomyces syringium TaxID=76729 RepID=UPI0036E48684